MKHIQLELFKEGEFEQKASKANRVQELAEFANASIEDTINVLLGVSQLNAYDLPMMVLDMAVKSQTRRWN